MDSQWKKLTEEEIKTRVFQALAENSNYEERNILGVPASYLDKKVFPSEAPFLKDAPFLSTLIKNPNHIGCHTLGNSESFFSGTQALEKEVIAICANAILKGAGDFDGYIASGGTEANVQACWIYRNYFHQEKGYAYREIGILCSEDNHYSMDKAANVLGIQVEKVKVNFESREITPKAVCEAIQAQRNNGVKAFIVVANMMTTMFGSVDDPSIYTSELEKENSPYFLHVDGAYGGFYFPFSNKNHALDFRNGKVTSVTLDAHKMAQAPYGTGIFIIRKELIQYANTKEASYVEGEDYTLIGSRSGANAIAVWMILAKYGPFGWMEKIFILQKRTAWLCDQLDILKIEYYRNQFANIVTIKAKHISPALALRFGLVPDNHSTPNWYKIVVMEHVTIEKIEPFIAALKN
jgi:tyrosine decarboxylase/aspartate 1-decarboxylase